MKTVQFSRIAIAAMALLLALTAGCGRTEEEVPLPPQAVVPAVSPVPGQPVAPQPGMPVPPTAPVPGIQPQQVPTAAPVPAVAAQVPLMDPAFAAKVAASVPLQPVPVPQELAGKQVTAIPCTIAGHAFLSGRLTSTIGRIEVATDGMLYVVDQESKIRRFIVGGAPTACNLTLDTGFGLGGVLAPGGAIKELSAGPGNRIYASTGTGPTYRIGNGQLEMTCATSRQGYLQVAPNGMSFFGHFASLPLRRVSYADSGCTVEEWPMDVPLKGVNQAAYLGDNIAIGGRFHEKVGSRNPRIVVVVDPTGRELYRFGSMDEGFGDERFAWIHAIEPCGPDVCVVDSNYRRLTMWKVGGQLAGSVDLSRLFGLRSPWITDMEALPGNAAFMPVTSQRRGQGEERTSGVYEGMISRLSWGV